MRKQASFVSIQFVYNTVVTEQPQVKQKVLCCS